MCTPSIYAWGISYTSEPVAAGCTADVATTSSPPRAPALFPDRPLHGSLYLLSYHFIVNGFLADATFEAHLRNLRDSNNNLLYSNSLLTSTPSSLVGRQIEYDNNGVFDTTQALMICGDFSKAVYSIRQDVTYKVLDQAVIQDTEGNIVYNLAQQDMIALRVVMRLGVQIANPVTRRKGKAGYPFAVLAPANS